MTRLATRTEPESVEDIVSSLRSARKWDGRMRVILGVAVPIALLALWELFARTGVVDVRFFPPPTQIAVQAGAFVTDPVLRADLLHDLAASGFRLLTGFAVGVGGGLVVGIAMGLYAPVRYGLNLLVYGVYPLPKLTLFPLMIVVFGIGELSKVVLIALGVFFMVAINAATGVLYSNPIYHDVAQSFRVPRVVRFRKIVIPSALPSIFAGLRLGFGQALILVVSTEFLASDDGIGHFIWNSWQVLDLSAMFVGLTIVGVAGALSAVGFDLFARVLTPWAGKR